jgi:pimeloyl-ACP methyl ester carboxylesterase
MRFHKVTGGGGAHIHVAESGNVQGRPILYIHGYSQCWMAWSRQMNSDLAQDHRLVAMDMRGHGLSDKPTQGYADTKMWADDVHAVIETLHLDQPVLCGWSYGALVILDYLRHFGTDHVAGLHFVGAVTRLGKEDAIAVLTPEFLGLVPGFFSTDVSESVRSLEAIVRLCFVREPAVEDRFLMLGYNVFVPPYVRKALFTRTVNNDDVLAKIRKPVLITHGANDAIVKPSAVNQHKASLPHAEVHVMENAGHAPFWDDAANFNRRQRAFSASLTQ